MLTSAELRCNPKKDANSLFWEEISACLAVHTCYVKDAYNCVQSIIFLPVMVVMSFVLLMLIRLSVSESKHWVTWSHRTGVIFPFSRWKGIQYFSVSASNFSCGLSYIWKIRNFCLLQIMFLSLTIKLVCLII